MLTIDEIKNILFFLNSSNISGQQAITLAVLQTKLSNMLTRLESPIPPQTAKANAEELKGKNEVKKPVEIKKESKK